MRLAAVLTVTVLVGWGCYAAWLDWQYALAGRGSWPLTCIVTVLCVIGLRMFARSAYRLLTQP